MMLRYWYLLRSSWPRLLDLVYWPTVQMVTWGFLQFYITQNAGFFAQAAGTFIGAVLLWDILFRGQLGFSISFMEEMWARNIGNLMMSPLRPFEFISALMVMSIVRLAIGTVPVTFLAIAFFGLESAPGHDPEKDPELAGAATFALGHAGPDGTLSAQAVATISQLPSGPRLNMSYRGCSPAAIAAALAFGG